MAQENQEAKGTEPTNKTFTQEDVDRIVTERLARVKSGNEEAEALKAKLAEYEKAEQERIQKQLEEQGQYRELTEKMKAQLAEATQKANQVTGYEEILQSTAQSIIEEIPEDLRSLVPELPIDKKLDWLRANRQKLVKPVAPSTAAGMRGAGGEGGESAPQELRQLGSAFGLTKEQQERAAKRYAEKANK